MLWELQLDLGLLDVIVDGRNKGFCYEKRQDRDEDKQKRNQRGQSECVREVQRNTVMICKIKSVGMGILRYLK